MTTEFIWPIRVYYEDTDAGGVVYYANYLKFYERARTEWLNKMNINQVELLDKNIVFVVTNAEIEYLKPAKLNNELVVKSRINKVSAASVEFEQELMLEKKGQSILLNRANVKVACLKLNSFSPCRIPAIVKEEFQRVS
jgi:acyl-CoA thioester hydrolase